MTEYMPSELVGEILKWLPITLLFPLRTLCKTAHAAYAKRIKSPIGLEITFVYGGYIFDYYYKDLCLSKVISYQKHQPIDISNLFPSSIVCLSLISCDDEFSITALQHCSGIQELYCKPSEHGMLTKELIKPLNKLAIIHFSECNNALRLKDLPEMGIYAYFPFCCYDGRIVTFPKNNHHPLSDKVHKLLDAEGYSQYCDSDMKKRIHKDCDLWTYPINEPFEKIYAFREKARRKAEAEAEAYAKARSIQYKAYIESGGDDSEGWW